MICLAIILSLITIFIQSFTLRRNREGYYLTIDNIFIILYLFLFTLIFPSSIILQEENIYNNGIGLKFFSELDCLLYYVCINICLFSISYVFNFFKNSLYLLSDNPRAKRNNPLLKKEDNFLFNVSLVFFIVGLISSYLFYFAYGGIISFMTHYAALLRAGTISISNNYSFLEKFIGFIDFSYVLLLGLLLGFFKQKSMCLLFFSISIILVIANAFASLGRVAFAMLFLHFILTTYILKSEKKYINTADLPKYILLLISFVYTVLLIGILMGRTGEFNYIEKIFNEICFVFNNFINLTNNDSSLFNRYFLDLFIWPFYLLPSSIWANILNIQSASEITTFMALGGVKGSFGITSTIPVDLISISYMQFGIIGCIIFPSAWTFFGCCMVRLVEYTFTNNSVILSLKVYILINYFLNGIIYGDPLHFIQSNIALIIFLLIIKCKKVKILIR